jgi:hypothetical protein
MVDPGLFEEPTSRTASLGGLSTLLFPEHGRPRLIRFLASVRCQIALQDRIPASFSVYGSTRVLWMYTDLHALHFETTFACYLRLAFVLEKQKCTESQVPVASTRWLDGSRLVT